MTETTSLRQRHNNGGRQKTGNQLYREENHAERGASLQCSSSKETRAVCTITDLCARLVPSSEAHPTNTLPQGPTKATGTNNVDQITSTFSQKAHVSNLDNVDLLMKIFDTVNLIGSIHCKRNSIQTFAADNAGETFRVIRLASCSQNLKITKNRIYRVAGCQVKSINE